MLLAVRISSYGCTWEVWRALKKLETHSAVVSSELSIYRVRISSWISSWIFKLDFGVGFWSKDFLAGFPINFQWFDDLNG